MAAVILTSLARAGKAGTFSGVGTANDTITIGGLAYKLVTTATTTALDVEIGASAAATATNLRLAINAGPTGSGTVWGSATTAHPAVTATDDGAGVVTVSARTAGAIGNYVVISENGTGFSWAGAATALSGGVGQLEELTEAALGVLKANKGLNADALAYVNLLLADLTV
jgi:hypothetical protein